MNQPQRFRVSCTLTFGDIYVQVMAWLGIILISVAASMATMAADSPQVAYFLVGLILVMSLPFLLFAFVTTLLNHIEIRTVAASEPAANEDFVAAPTAVQTP